MKKILKKKILFLTILVIIIFFSLLFLLGDFLSPQDKLEKADCIVVISGGENIGRTLEGINLFKEGWAPYLLFSGAAKSGNVSNAKIMKNYALKKGIPKDKIFIEEYSTSTYENALFSKKILENNKFKSIILVTSPYHQRRAYISFRYALGPNFKIINHSFSDSSWKKNNWWLSKENIKLTLEEFFGAIYLILTKNYSQKFR